MVWMAKEEVSCIREYKFKFFLMIYENQTLNLSDDCKDSHWTQSLFFDMTSLIPKVTIQLEWLLPY